VIVGPMLCAMQVEGRQHMVEVYYTEEQEDDFVDAAHIAVLQVWDTFRSLGALDSPMCIGGACRCAIKGLH
jgi:hypothetical protein